MSQMRELYYSNHAIRSSVKSMIARRGEDELAQRQGWATGLDLVKDANGKVKLCHSFRDCDCAYGIAYHTIPAQVMAYVKLANCIGEQAEGPFSLTVMP